MRPMVPTPRCGASRSRTVLSIPHGGYTLGALAIALAACSSGAAGSNAIATHDAGQSGDVSVGTDGGTVRDEAGPDTDPGYDAGQGIDASSPGNSGAEDDGGAGVVEGPPGPRCLSELWGEAGELWDRDGRLPDITNVGYRGGEEPIPDWPVGVSVNDFGATPDDDTDDSDAFRRAMEAVSDSHAVLVPRGRYIIASPLTITRDSFVIRGEDMYETVLFFPRNSIETDPPTERQALISFEGSAQQGLENLSLVFREQMKMAHWEFRGADAVFFGNTVTDSWARNLYIVNADHGITAHGTRLSVMNIIFDHYIGRHDIIGTSGVTGWVGHVGIGLTSHHSLFHNIEFRGRYFHDFDIINVPTHNVISNITGADATLHHHGQAARHNTYTNVDLGAGTRGLNGLSDTPGRQRGEVHWGIFGDATLPGAIPEDSQNGHVFVGYNSDEPERATDTLWVERCDPAELHPANIYLAQLERAGRPLPPGPPPAPPTVDPAGTNVLRLGATDDVRFDLTRVSWGSLHRARLRLNASRASNAPFSVEVVGVRSGSGDDAMLSATLDTAEVPTNDRHRWLEFDVTSFVAERLAAGEADVEFHYQMGPAGTFNGQLSTGADGGNRPLLVLERTDSAVSGPPAAPTGLTTTAAAGHILLDWNDSPESDVLYYNVYRRGGETVGTNFVEPLATGLIYSDYADVTFARSRSNCDMPSDRDFHYVVTAVDEHYNESPLSSESLGRALPAPP